MAGSHVLFSLASLALVVAQGAPRDSPEQPWRQPYVPSRLEWEVVQSQIAEGDPEFGDDGMTVHYFLDATAYQTGTISCDLAFLGTTPARFLKLKEDGIRARFRRRAAVPGSEWMKLDLRIKEAK